MSNQRLGEPGNGREMRAPHAVVVVSALRVTATVIALGVLYYVLPLDRTLHLSQVAGTALSLAAFGLLALGQVRSITRAAYPGVRAVEVLALLVPVFILFFASVYYVMERNSPSSFSAPLSRTDALYFTVTVLSTVGFGDIVAVSETARVVVLAQMLTGLVVVGVLVRLVVELAQRTRAQRSVSDTSTPNRQQAPVGSRRPP